MATVTDIGTLIVRTPEVRRGRPRVAGTGVTVRRIVGWYKLGLSPEAIADEFGHSSLAQVYAALAYDHANREEIEADLRRRGRRGGATGAATRSDDLQGLMTMRLSLEEDSMRPALFGVRRKTS